MQRIRKSFLTLAATAGLLLGAGIAATPATAAPVTFNFTGTINTSQFPLTSSIVTSDTVKGTFTFDALNNRVATTVNGQTTFDQSIA